LTLNSQPALNDSPASAERASHTCSIGPLWRRFLAFLVDGLVLYCVGRGFGTVLFDPLSRIGLWGRLVGFCIAVLYFASFDSYLGKGQTLGKRLLNLRVADAQGNAISLGRSAIRYSVFAAPQFLNGLRFPETQTLWIVSALISFAVITVGGSSFYLLVFNRQTRQGLHDLAVGSYVIRAGGACRVRVQPIWDEHWRVLRWLLSLLVVLSVFTGLFNYRSVKSGHVGQGRSDARLVEQLDRVKAVRVLNWTPSKWMSIIAGDSAPKEKALAITVWEAGESNDDAAFADQVARLILQNDPRAQGKDLLWVQVGRGYNLGIASHDRMRSFMHTPAEWRKRAGSFPAGSTLVSPQP